MLKRIDSALVVNILIAIAILLLLANILSLNSSSPNGNSQYLINLFKDPIVLSIIGGALTFLLVDRWRKIEGEISEIRQGQASALSDIREDAKKFTEANIDTATRKAQSTHDRIDSLLDNHPWIADITENDFVPDASSCKIILRTAEDMLLKGKTSLAYEYLFSWTRHNDKKLSIEGTADDFLDLAEFCERVLGDEYLGFLIVREGVNNATNRQLLLPDYLKRLTRHGRFSDAEKTSRQLYEDIEQSWYDKIIAFIQRKRFYRGSRYLNLGYISLALHEATSGDRTKAAKFLERAKSIAKKIDKVNESVCAEAEIALIFGDFEKAQTLIERLNGEDSTSDDTAFELSRLYLALGQIDLADNLSNRFLLKYEQASQISETSEIHHPVENIADENVVMMNEKSLEEVIASKKPFEEKENTQAIEKNQGAPSDGLDKSS